MFKHLFIAVLLLFSLQASATHFSGGYLRYEYTGNGLLYNVELILYKTCETGSIDLPSFIKIRAVSNAKSTDINRNLPLISNDTLEPYCPGTTNTCMNLTALYPGYIVAVYKDTMTLPFAANDWRFVFSNSNRNFGIDNIQGASGQSYYIEAILDSTRSVNSSSYMPDNPPHVLFTNDTVSIPLTASDKNGDEIRYRMVNPVFDQNMNIPYYTGYSVSNPFGTGGLCTISNDNLIMMCPTAGKYTLAMRIEEYHNGKMVAYTMRDFVIICVNSTSGGGVSIPLAVDNNKFQTYTCPGKSNILNLTFEDPEPTDSVYVSIETPNFSGWTFNTSKSQGIGVGKANINWVTPNTLNPLTLTNFDIKVTVRDNACRKTGEATYVYTVKTRDCSADSVWPGDANSDKIVDLYDPLAVALAYNDTGAIRANASNIWTGQSCNPWPSSFLNNIDKKHADCDGNGLIDTADLNVIALNYTQTHKKGSSRSQEKTTGTPILTFDHTGISPNPDSIVTIAITLGDASSTVSNLYGLAANIQVGGIGLASSPVISYNTSWLGNSTNTLAFTKNISATSVDWAYSRINKSNISGAGTLAQIAFQIPANAVDGQLVTLKYDKAKLINKDGVEIVGFDTKEDTFYIRKPASVISGIGIAKDKFKVYPNPSDNDFNIICTSNIPEEVIITLNDITGKEVLHKKVLIAAGKNNIHFDTPANLQSGVYIINIHGATSKNIKWIKE